MKKLWRLIFSFCLLSMVYLALANTNANSNTLNNNLNLTPNNKPDPYAYNWSVMVYEGWMTDVDIANILLAPKIKWAYGTITSVEIAHQLAPTNFVRRILQPFVSTVDFAVSGTYRDDPNGSIAEIAPYFMLRWEHFPWEKYVLTSFGIGEGISYADIVPYREASDRTYNPKRLMNYVQFEADFGLPKYPNWRVVALVHHRCDAWGFYGADNASSNAVGVGIKYLF